jgi:1-acyl-sn-glycerol-3-phosphate acyltransferase
VAPVVQVWRCVRVTVHVLQGLATTIAVFPFVARNRQRASIHRWSRKLLELLGVEARVHGRLAQRGNVLIVANHISWLDIFVINAVEPARFVAKAELARWPLVGGLIRRAGTIFVSRERRHDTRRVNHQAAEALAAGDVVAVFPEGTTTDGAALLKFHASLLQPIVDSHGHVQPMAIAYRDASGARSQAPLYGDETFAESFWRVCGASALAVDVVLPAPVAAHGLQRRDLASAAESAIRKALGLPAVATAPARSIDPAG